MLSIVGLQVLDGPLAVGKALLSNLGPSSAVSVRGNVGDMDSDGTLVGAVNDIVVPVVVEPLDVKLITGLCGDKGRNGAVVDVAVDIGRLDILDGRAESY